MRTRYLFTLILLNFSLYSQYNSTGYGLGAAQVRGETDAQDTWISNPGLAAYGYYNYWLPQDERFQLSFLVDINLLSSRKYGDEGLQFEVHSTLYIPKIGLRFYLDDDLQSYEPDLFQDAFFMGIYGGACIYHHDYGTVVLLQEVDGEIHPDLGVSVILNGLVGYRIYISRSNAIEFSFAGSYGFNDYWDGYKGNTGINDWHFQVNLGLMRSFY